MNCQHARLLLSDRLDAPLSPTEAAALTAHLSNCPACTEYEAQLQSRMGRIARLPDLPLPAPAARATRRPASPVGLWLTRGAQLAGALLAVLLVARLTSGLLRPRAAQLDRPLPTSAALAYGATAVPTDPNAPAQNASITSNTFGGATSLATPVATTAQPIIYTQGWPLADQDQLWGQVARDQGEAIGAILRPGYLPEGLQHAQIGRLESASGRFAVSFVGDGARQVRITAGFEPEQLFPTDTLVATPSAPLTVRGQSTTFIGPTGADNTMAVTWQEPGRWAARGGLFGAERIPYTLSVQGYDRAELERIAASLAPQLSAPNAADVVRRYYAAINARDYRAAYALFDQSWQQDYDAFAQGFADTARDDIDLLGVIAGDTPGRYFVQIRLLASRTDGGHQWYSGTYEIGGAPGVARIIGADVMELTDDQAAQLAPKGPPACTEAQLGVTVRPQVLEDGRLVDILVSITNNGVPCRLATPLTVTIATVSGQPLTLTGNALTLTPNGALDAANLGLSFGWRNWCGDAGPYTLRATLGTKTAESPINQPPACSNPGTPSRLEWR